MVVLPGSVCEVVGLGSAAAAPVTVRCARLQDLEPLNRLSRHGSHGAACGRPKTPPKRLNVAPAPHSEYSPPRYREADL